MAAEMVAVCFALNCWYYKSFATWLLWNSILCITIICFVPKYGQLLRWHPLSVCTCGYNKYVDCALLPLFSGSNISESYCEWFSLVGSTFVVANPLDTFSHNQPTTPGIFQESDKNVSLSILYRVYMETWAEYIDSKYFHISCKFYSYAKTCSRQPCWR